MYIKFGRLIRSESHPSGGMQLSGPRTKAADKPRRSLGKPGAIVTLKA